MVIAQIKENYEKTSNRLLKHIIKCYNRLTENPRAQLALGQNMPEIVKEIRKIEKHLDQNSRGCLNNLCEVLENLQCKVDNMSMQFDFQNIPKEGNGLDFNSVDGVKYASIHLLKNSQDMGSNGIFGGAPATGFGQPTQTNQSGFSNMQGFNS